MTADEVLRATVAHFEKIFQDFEQRIQQKLFSIDKHYSYPKTIRLGETSTQWIVELLGSTSIKKTKKYHISLPSSPERVVTADSFVNVGYRNKKIIDKPIFDIRSHDNTFINLAIATPYNKTLFEEKLNFKLNPTQLNATYQTDTLLKFSPTADKIILENIDLIRSDGIMLFYKRIGCMIIVKKDTTSEAYSQWLEKFWVDRRISLAPDLGINIGYDSNIDKFSSDLSGLSSQDVSENIIDTFIKNHKDYFCKALGHVEAIPQMRLPLLNKEGFNKDDQFLQPDYLLKRADGYCDILDLKKSLIEEKTLVKGKKKRIMFKDYVGSLIGQLNGYKRYFNDPEHIKLAKKQGIIVNNPKLYGIVGNHNNFVFEDVQLALEPYKDNIVLLGYNSIVDLLKKWYLNHPK